MYLLGEEPTQVNSLKSLALVELLNWIPSVPLLSIYIQELDLLTMSQIDVSLPNGAVVYHVNQCDGLYACLHCRSLLSYGNRHWDKHKCPGFQGLTQLTTLNWLKKVPDIPTLEHLSLVQLVKTNSRVRYSKNKTGLDIAKINFGYGTDRTTFDVLLDNKTMFPNIEWFDSQVKFCRSCLGLYISNINSEAHNCFMSRFDRDKPSSVFFEQGCEDCGIVVLKDKNEHICNGFDIDDSDYNFEVCNDSAATSSSSDPDGTL